MASPETSTFRVTFARPSPVQRLAIVLVLIVGVVIGLVIVLPLAILFGVLGVLFVLWMRIKAWFANLGGRPREGRRNVRVIGRSN